MNILLDSGFQCVRLHMTGDSQLFDDLKPWSTNLFVCIADGSSSKLTGLDSLTMSQKITLKYVLFVPILTYNLLSVVNIH